MTSIRALELTTQILEDPNKAVPLLQLLHAVANARGDPLGEAMVHDLLLHVWTKVPTCEEAMIDFLSEQELTPTQRAA